MLAAGVLVVVTACFGDAAVVAVGVADVGLDAAVATDFVAAVTVDFVAAATVDFTVAATVFVTLAATVVTVPTAPATGVFDVTAGVVTRTGGVVAVTAGVVTRTGGVETVAEGVVTGPTTGAVTVTAGTVALTAGTVTLTAGTVTLTAGTDTPTDGVVTGPTRGAFTVTAGTETPGTRPAARFVLVPCANADPTHAPTTSSESNASDARVRPTFMCTSSHLQRRRNSPAITYPGKCDPPHTKRVCVVSRSHSPTRRNVQMVLRNTPNLPES